MQKRLVTTTSSSWDRDRTRAPALFGDTSVIAEHSWLCTAMATCTDCRCRRASSLLRAESSLRPGECRTHDLSSGGVDSCSGTSDQSRGGAHVRCTLCPSRSRLIFPIIWLSRSCSGSRVVCWRTLLERRFFRVQGVTHGRRSYFYSHTAPSQASPRRMVLRLGVPPIEH